MYPLGIRSRHISKSLQNCMIVMSLFLDSIPKGYGASVHRKPCGVRWCIPNGVLSFSLHRFSIDLGFLWVYSEYTVEQERGKHETRRISKEAQTHRPRDGR